MHEWRMKSILIIGATSAIAEATAKRFITPETSFFLAGRNTERLSRIAADLKLRGAGAVHTAGFDASDLESHQRLLDQAYEQLGGFDIILLAYGTLGNQKQCEEDVDKAVSELSNNAVTTIALLSRLANMMERDGRGTLAVISSVAGDRGRASNYVYGSAKAAVSTFNEGLRSRLHDKGVHVLTIKPGMVATPMTYGLALPSLLLASPELVAGDIVRAIEKRKEILYTPGYWNLVMAAIKLIPAGIFKKLPL